MAVFTVREELEYYFNEVTATPLKLDPLMTFLLGTFYFQYHLHQLYLRQQEQYSSPVAT